MGQIVHFWQLRTIILFGSHSYKSWQCINCAKVVGTFISMYKLESTYITSPNHVHTLRVKDYGILYSDIDGNILYLTKVAETM